MYLQCKLYGAKMQVKTHKGHLYCFPYLSREYVVLQRTGDVSSRNNLVMLFLLQLKATRKNKQCTRLRAKVNLTKQTNEEDERGPERSIIHQHQHCIHIFYLVGFIYAENDLTPPTLTTPPSHFDGAICSLLRDSIHSLHMLGVY